MRKLGTYRIKCSEIEGMYLYTRLCNRLYMEWVSVVVMRWRSVLSLTVMVLCLIPGVGETEGGTGWDSGTETVRESRTSTGTGGTIQPLALENHGLEHGESCKYYYMYLYTGMYIHVHEGVNTAQRQLRVHVYTSY